MLALSRPPIIYSTQCYNGFGTGFRRILVRMGANVQNQGVHAVCGQRGGVIKQRIARSGQGKSGGFRALIVFRAGARAIFVHGFAKSEKDNIEKDELVALKKLAAELSGYDDKMLARAVASGVLLEVKCNEKAVS